MKTFLKKWYWELALLTIFYKRNIREIGHQRKSKTFVFVLLLDDVENYIFSNIK